MKKKLVGFVIEPVESKDWGLVNKTQYFSDGSWLCGLNEVTTIEAVAQEAFKKKINIIPISCLKKERK